jgi:hypothetical protein
LFNSTSHPKSTSSYDLSPKNTANKANKTKTITKTITKANNHRHNSPKKNNNNNNNAGTRPLKKTHPNNKAKHSNTPNQTLVVIMDNSPTSATPAPPRGFVCSNT